MGGEEDAHYFAFERVGRRRTWVLVPLVGRNETGDEGRV